jgi:hypothetical protein
MDPRQARLLVESWRELNLFLSRCRESDVVLPLLRYAVGQRVRWPVVERVWQRFCYLRRREERDLLLLGVVPMDLKE